MVLVMNIHGTVQRVQALLRTCRNEVVAVNCGGMLVLVRECHRNCFHGRGTICEQSVFLPADFMPWKLLGHHS